VETIRTDVAIIGAGGAGLRAAIALAEADAKLRIALISKVYPMRSHTCAAEGGAAGVIKPDDSLEHHFNDTVGGGDWLSDQDAVQYLVEEAPKELIQLEHWGCPWSREPNGSVAVRPFGGMKKQRTWFAADKSGFHILHTLFQTSLQFDSIQRFDEYYVTELLVDEGRCTGLVAIEMRSGQMRRFDAKAVIIAGGGAGRMFPFTTNGAIKTGDGMALAYRAGVPLKDMEFVQYHPTGLPSTGTLLTEACRGEGGVLLNKNGRRFLQDYGMGPETPLGKPVLKTMELGPRDRVSQAFWHEQKKGNAVPTQWGDAMLLDMRHLGEKTINERLPLVRDMSISYMGVDPVTDPVPVRPVVHYMMGGIHTDIKSATPLPGLFAAGECACVSINGANRLGSNSLTELLVFGRRAALSAMAYVAAGTPAAREAAREALGAAAQGRVRELMQRSGGTETVAGLRREMMQTMEDNAGIYRTGEGLAAACAKLADLRRRYLQDYDMGPETPIGKPVFKTMELGPRDRLSQAFWHEERKGNTVPTPWGESVLLDLRHLGEKKIDERLPLVRDMSISYMGVDPVKEPVPVRPVVHYMMGGIHTDTRAATPLAGLFAAGECACVSINGANRLGSNSLTELLVFGRRAALSALEFVEGSSGRSQVNPSQAEAAQARIRALFQRSGGTESVAGLRREMMQTMEQHAGIYRTGEGLAEACAKLSELRRRYARVELHDKTNVYNTDLLQTLELGSMLDCAEAVAASAAARKESRGAHQRLDHTARDDAGYLRHSLAYFNPVAAPRIDYCDVVITKSQPGVRDYSGDHA